MSKILVTGGLGFIGSNLINLLLKKKFQVLNIDKVTYASNFFNTIEYKKNKKYNFIKCDLNNEKKLKNVIRNFNQMEFLILQQKHMLIDLLMGQRILFIQTLLALLIC